MLLICVVIILLVTVKMMFYLKGGVMKAAEPVVGKGELVTPHLGASDLLQEY